MLGDEGSGSRVAVRLRPAATGAWPATAKVRHLRMRHMARGTPRLGSHIPRGSRGHGSAYADLVSSVIMATAHAPQLFSTSFAVN